MIEWHAEPIHICRYPFLSAASGYVEKLNVTLEDLITAASFELARLRGKERIIAAINEGMVRIRKPVMMSQVQAEMELLSYPFARILVSCIGDPYLVRRYAIAESKSAYEQLKEDVSTGTGTGTGIGAGTGTEIDIIYEMANEFNIPVGLSRLQQQEREHEQIKVQLPFVDYLRLTSNLRDKRWKLVNRGLEQGHVRLSKAEFLRIIQEAIHDRIKKDLPLAVPSGLCESVRRYTEVIEAELEKRRKKSGVSGFDATPGFRVKDPDCFPPCITVILSNLKDGLNVPHTGRFAVTAFLLSIGLTIDEITEIYKNSPDFNEEKTRYQVEHIAGTGTGDLGTARYKAPSCETMRTYGNCANVNNDEVCKEINYPLSYYKLKLKLKRDVF